ncbi:uncharacterized protein LOC122853855 [Aphidius gifuensis]|uniref:uncharacterized protein LOC122853855 n=1 Tax=Aphidius gifuensis TaxID=684658 RepID=UPI001CDD202D|nr:uncharacterized protein LOC122853855 [Aphidius gifuensis]
MIHSPCGPLNITSPCMQNGKCSKGFSKLFTIETQSGQDGYPKYQRRSPEDGGQTFQLRKSGRMVTIDNRWIVPYSPVLLRAFDCHINIEPCHSVKAIQYICSYINKGSDQAAFSVESRDEIKAFQNGRYISSSEAAWRIFGFTIHERSPVVFQLSVHLENGQRVYFTDQNARERLENVRNTTLMAFFELCSRDDFAKTLLYIEVSSYFTFTNNRFNRRKQGSPVEQYPGVKKSNMLGRVYTVHPTNVECYYLRMLLHHVRGPTSFVDLKTVDDVIHPTFQRACQALGLLEDESHWNATLEEAVLFQSASNLRELFVTMIAFCHITNLTELWETHRESMSLDILQQERHRSGNRDFAVTPYILNKTLILIENDLLKISGKKLSDFNMESPSRTDDNDDNFLRDRAYIAETSYDLDILSNYIQENEPKLTDDQQAVYNTILQSVLQNTGKLFFLDAPGGAGKTFMLNLLLSKLRVQGIISLAVASSGIAATLLQNGKTAHSAFKLPLDLQTTEHPVCSVKKQSSLGKLLRETRFIVWDESTMANKGGPEALDRTLKDFKSDDCPMGGVVVLFAGDFRQILPVVPKGSESDEINACLKSSYLWSSIASLRLTTNMRVHLGGDNNADLFSQTLLKIGSGTFQNDNDSTIQITSTFAISVLDQNNVINKVYLEISQLPNKSNEWLRERAILAPKNDTVNVINEKILSMFEADEKTYISF